MHREFTIKPLTPGLLDKAYPLAQALDIEDLARWRAFVGSRAAAAAGESGDTGAIAAETPNGCLCGLLLYRVDHGESGGPTLVCDPFVVADMPRYATPTRALLEAADRIAVERGCTWVRVVLPAAGTLPDADGSGCEAALFRAGYALESLSFRRRRALPESKARPPTVLKPNCKPRLNAR
jgi:hypothetical protein